MHPGSAGLLVCGLGLLDPAGTPLDVDLQLVAVAAGSASVVAPTTRP